MDIPDFIYKLEASLKAKDNKYRVMGVGVDKEGLYIFLVMYGDDRFIKPLSITPDAIKDTYHLEDIAKVTIEFFDNKNNFIMN